MKKSLLPYILVAAIGVTAGVGITAVLEDVAGMPYEKVDFNLFDPENVNIDALIDMIADHPEWSDAIFDWIKEHPDMLDDLTPEQLADLIGEHPEMAEDILNNLADKLSPEELADLLNDPALADLIAENPELAALAAGYIISQMGDIDFSEEAPEPGLNNGGSINAAMGSSGSIDNGTLDPDLYQQKVFSFDSNYSGTVYLRSSSKGDYSSEKRGFLDAPEFDNSTYYVSPLLFAGSALAQSYSSPLSIRLNMHMGDFRDEGMIVGDYVGSSYTVNGESGKFSRLYENKLGNIDISDYTVTAYPTADIGSGSYVVPNALSEPEKRYRKWVKSNYLDVPDSIRNRLRSFLDDHGLYTPTDVQNYLKSHYKYEVGTFHCPSDKDIVVTFLTEASGGTCTNFASAMTLLCRTLGKPARFVTGYLVNAKNGSNDVLGNMGHAWTEVYADGVGWQRYDATASLDYTPDPDQEPPATDKMHNQNNLTDISNSLNTDKLFSVEVAAGYMDYPKDVILRSRAYDKYNPSSFTFEPVKVSDEDKTWMNSLFYVNNVYEEHSRNVGVSAAREVQIQYSQNFVPDGLLSPVGAVDPNYISDGRSKTLFQMDDSRLYRDDAQIVTMAYLPETAYTIVGEPHEEQYEYYNQLMNTTYYSEYPESLSESLDNLADLIRRTKNEPSLTPAVVNEFFEEHFYDEGLAPSTRYNMGLEPINQLLNDPSLQHMGYHSLFAGLETLLLRRIGYRARFVDGFKVKLDEYSNNNVTYSSSYSWVECFDDEHLYWQPFMFDTWTRYKKELHYVFNDDDKPVYDGTRKTTAQDPQPSENYGDVIAGGDHIEWVFKGNPVNVGKYRIRVDRENTKVYNVFGDDVTNYYDLIIDSAGILSIKEKPINVFTASLDALSTGYNPSDDVNNAASISDLAPGDYAEFTFPNVTYDSAGDYENTCTVVIRNSSGEDVTRNYHITYHFGTLKVEGS